MMKQRAIELYNLGLSKKEISSELKIGYSTVRKYLIGLPKIVKNNRNICKTCGENDQLKFYKTQKYHCKSCWNQITYNTGKEKILKYMEGRGGAKCSRCGYDKYIGALDFHHRDPKEKDPLWSRGWNLEKLKKELDKCDILCSNCHREVHANL